MKIAFCDWKSKDQVAFFPPLLIRRSAFGGYRARAGAILSFGAISHTESSAYTDEM